MTTFVALGDSITLGVGDPIRLEDPAGGRGRRAWRGWAVLLAAGLAVADVLALAGFMVAHARAAVCHPTGDRVIWAEQ